MTTEGSLNAKTVSFLDLMGNGRTYTVPPYQRDYSWTEDQWEDLWVDLLDVESERPTGPHYMGAVVLRTQSDREYVIIDGQQRIATLTILVLAVIQALTRLGSQGATSALERAELLRRGFVGDKDPASLMEVSKLSLNETDDGFFKQYLVQLREPSTTRGLKKSQKQLKGAFDFFRFRLERDGIAMDEARLARLVSEAVGRRLHFIQITVESDLNAYTVFETLNARGVELNTTDLLKNFLFSKPRTDTDLDALRREWTMLIETVPAERFPDFLRYHYLTRERQVRKSGLFKRVRGDVSDASDAFRLLGELQARAALFAALRDSNDEYWKDRPGCAQYVRELNLFDVRQPTPLLFAAEETLAPEEFRKVLKLVVAISFRHTVIGSRNTNELEPAYHAAAKAVLTGSATTARGVSESLRSLAVSDESFMADFASAALPTGGSRKKLAKYVLAKIEGEAGERSVDWETDPATIEHVLPQNPGPEWDADFPGERSSEAVYRLGNLALLEGSPNRRIGTLPFAEKREAYAESGYATTRELAERYPDEWTPATIDLRQSRMAEVAKRVWRNDFG